MEIIINLLYICIYNLYLYIYIYIYMHIRMSGHMLIKCIINIIINK